ncbi:NAC domain-containing protein 72-like [Olea europaea var. sylvestris]|uniref:NAC domain-containing 72-like n=1 Tax=Olea europaea subsp. europaea TaxID=158383 RepID=A0A8S0S9J8_OLEEU|nr:NAC domain-containing protein 72-like [Olea europaea var. sylvestris]CAA2988356.1 NAC domain-containing 72-like [Olea europaea subsp. europaea]
MDEGKQVVMAAQEEGSHFYDHKNLPLGYRFVPTDKDLLYYLNLKILNKPVPTDAIIDVELYKYHPHDLCQNSRMHGTKEWYFFTSRARRYNNGGRPNRTAANGYWKATGGDVVVQSKGQEVGRKKVLVYYEGKSKNQKTNWIMHEFTIHQMKDVARSSTNPIPDDKMLDKCLCRIYYRTSKSSKNEEQDRQENLIPIQDNNTAHVAAANLAVTSNQNHLPSPFDQPFSQDAYFPHPQANPARQSNNDQYPPVEPCNPPLTYMRGDHMTMQRNIQYSLLPSPQNLACVPGQYNPSLPPGSITNMPSNCTAMESNDQYQPITLINGDVGCSSSAKYDDDIYLDLTAPCFSSLSDLLPTTDPSNFAVSTSANNDNECIDLSTPTDWLDRLDLILPSLDPTMLDFPLGDSSNRLFQSENVGSI